jgi:hypothetical protein
MDNIPTALYIAIAIGLLYLGAWVQAFVKWRRAQRKTVASKPVTNWLIYDSTGRRKELRREIHEDMKRKEGKG